VKTNSDGALHRFVRARTSVTFANASQTDTLWAMASFPAKDLRRSERHWTAVPVVIRNGSSRVEGVSINISESGMYLFAAADLRVGDQVEVEFRRAHEKEAVRVCGVVRRRALYLYAVEFLAEAQACVVAGRELSAVASK
jgi:PilZ domain